MQVRIMNAPKPQPDDWKCEACNGTRMAVPDCETCEGNGWVYDEEDGGTMCCPDCGGDECDVCHGTGEKP
jgi:hypothetical protein